MEPKNKSLTSQEDRSGSFNFGVPTPQERKALDALVGQLKRKKLKKQGQEAKEK